MAQNSTGTANSVNPYSGGNVATSNSNDPKGVGTQQGAAVISADSGQLQLTAIEYRYTTNFPTDTIRKGI